MSRPDGHTSLEVAGLDSRECYRLLTAAVIPRPIALVSTLGPDGTPNLAPFSFFNLVSTAPPVALVSIDLELDGREKDTSLNLRRSGECVINIVDEDLAERMVHSSLDWAESVDEFEQAAIEPAPSHVVAPPRVAESPVNLECRTMASFEFGEATAYFVEILVIHVADGALSGGRIDSASLKAVGRLGGADYCGSQRIRTLPRVNPPEAERAGEARQPPRGLGARAVDRRPKPG